MLTKAERDRLTGTFDERLKVATVAMAPSLVTFNDNSSGDAKLVDAMCPDDYELRLWRFVVEHHARKQIASDAFGDAFGKAEAKIEQQLALEGDVIGAPSLGFTGAPRVALPPSSVSQEERQNAAWGGASGKSGQ